ncbi:hypothetical protein ACEWAU_22275 [Vibrio parahaemolyticus]|uniref:hypothetical protein n=1 Tax=Vibrio parahaemolyticus TaxID=670 RepID=UPI0005428A79|nr:hypothetical protein [Vibrio parahaemolyticus]KHF15869.1 hypothetical protein PO80_09040 [Vibrio parahaemolyticus]MBE3888623.1 hypothetical protein [Vibrio parahaemolyticus]OTV95946.1 hypothetical protein BA739_24130 [Vibrio parahaemolyticus]OTW00016.1 hypothetical protein BA740_24130 [Vibrio parahaemolyticus]TNY52546.1 hypothetical protein CGK67_23100 [Vibrio parahaemolyticus]
MSANINLVEYHSGGDGKLYETKTELIGSSYITNSLLEMLKKSFSLVEKEIYETIGENDCYSIECFDDADVEEIIKTLEDIFLSILKSDSEKLLGNSASKVGGVLPVLQETHINSNELVDSISRFRTLTNVINLFNLKQVQYNNNASVVLKIG